MFDGSNWVCTSSVNGKWSDGATSGDIVYTGGDVGIGTSSPDEELTVDGDIKLRGYGKLHFSNTSDQTYINSPASDTMAFYNTGEEVMRINADGNVGIGTKSPAANLEISSGNDGDAVLRIEANEDNNNQREDHNPSIEFFQDGALSGMRMGLTEKAGDSSNSFAFFHTAGGTELETPALVIEQDNTIQMQGNVGIGTTSPGYELDVAGQINSDAERIGEYEKFDAGQVSANSKIPRERPIATFVVHENRWSYTTGFFVEAHADYYDAGYVKYYFDVGYGTVGIEKVSSYGARRGNFGIRVEGDDGVTLGTSTATSDKCTGGDSGNNDGKQYCKYILYTVYAQAENHTRWNVSVESAGIDMFYGDATATGWLGISKDSSMTEITEDDMENDAPSISLGRNGVGIGTASPKADLDASDVLVGYPSIMSRGKNDYELDFAVPSTEYIQFGHHDGTSNGGTTQLSINPSGKVGIGTTAPAARLHVESTNRTDSINRRCHWGTIWAGHFKGNANHDWNGDEILDGRDYNVLDGIDNNDYLEDNECVVFGASTENDAGAEIGDGEFWVDTDLDRTIDSWEIITGATTNDTTSSSGVIICPAGDVWLDQNSDGIVDAYECITPLVDAENTPAISRVDFTGESCPTGTQKRDENDDGNTDDGECHIPALFVQPNGNVGIGTTEPTGALEVSSDINQTLTLDFHPDDIYSSYAWQSFEFNGEQAWRIAGRNDDDNNNASLNILNQDKSYVATFLQDGNVGIGTISPDGKLDIRAGSNDEVGLVISESDDNGFLLGSIFSPGEGDNGIGIFRTEYGQNDGATFADPTKLFHVLANGNAWLKRELTENSDSRYKKDIQTLPSALQNILSLRGVSYYWKDGSDTSQHIGVISQEVEKVYPQLVRTDEDGYKSVAYSHLVSPLIEAVKELHALYQGHADRIAALETQNAHQDERIAQLEEQNSALEEQNVGLLKTVVQLEVRLAALEAAQ